MLALVCAGAATVDAGEARAVQLVQRSQRSLSTLPTLQRVNAAPRLDPAGNQLKATIATPASPSAENGPGILRRATVRVSGYAAPADCDDQLSDAEGLPKMPPADATSDSPAVGTRVRQVSLEDETLSPVADNATVRKFKRMSEILPHYDYTPEATGGRCENLCPRPGEPDCPDCPPYSNDVNVDGCPECPVEIRLVDVDPHTSLVAPTGVRPFEQINYCWEPSNLYHLPLYFEDPCLERYGHTRCYVVQPLFSTGLFCAQLFGLPYQMTIDPICKKRYVLGWYRPGRYVPYRYYQIPWNTEAAIVQAAFVTGGYYLFAPGVSP